MSILQKWIDENANELRNHFIKNLVAIGLKPTGVEKTLVVLMKHVYAWSQERETVFQLKGIRKEYKEAKRLLEIEQQRSKVRGDSLVDITRTTTDLYNKLQIAMKALDSIEMLSITSSTQTSARIGKEANYALRKIQGGKS